jgi:hypothetical protein
MITGLFQEKKYVPDVLKAIELPALSKILIILDVKNLQKPAGSFSCLLFHNM